MTVVLYAIAAILALLVMIMVHEFGHYITGRLLGFRILEYSVGFGPAIFKKEKNEILYSVRCVPLGGFCKFKGEDEDDDNDPRAMNNMPAWKRVIVLASGAIFNLIFSIILAFMILWIAGAGYPKTETVTYNSPAYGVLQVGDEILSVNGNAIDLTSEIRGSNGKPIKVEWRRDGKVMSALITPELAVQKDADGKAVLDADGNEVKAYMIGVTMKNSGSFTMGEAFGRSFQLCGFYAGTIFDFIANFNIDNVGGPVTTIASVATTSAEFGFMTFLSMFVFIGVNLAVFNLLPIPALDGARIVFVVIYGIIEKIKGRKVSRNAEAMIHTIGLMLLFGLVIFAEINQFLR